MYTLACRLRYVLFQVMMQLERMFGEGAKSALTFSSHRWGDQPLTSGNGGGKGGGHDDMGSPELRIPFVSRDVACSMQCTANPLLSGLSTEFSRALVSYPTSWQREW